jgi:hypothetical protein
MDLALDAIFEQVRRHPKIERVFLEMAIRDPEVAAIRDAFDALAQEALAHLIGAAVPVEVIPDPRAAAYVVQHAALEVALAELGLRGESRRVGERAAKLALREMIHRYIFPEAPPPAASPRPARSRRSH